MFSLTGICLSLLWKCFSLSAERFLFSLQYSFPEGFGGAQRKGLATPGTSRKQMWAEPWKAGETLGQQQSGFPQGPQTCLLFEAIFICPVQVPSWDSGHWRKSSYNHDHSPSVSSINWSHLKHTDSFTSSSKMGLGHSWKKLTIMWRREVKGPNSW